MRATQTFGWPSGAQEASWRQQQALQLQSAAAAVGLGALPLSTPLSRLSGGYCRRVALAGQLARGADVLLLDEPLAGLDWRARQELVPVLTRLKRGRALLIASHDLADLLPVADAVWRLEEGGRLAPVPDFRAALGDAHLLRELDAY